MALSINIFLLILYVLHLSDVISLNYHNYNYKLNINNYVNNKYYINYRNRESSYITTLFDQSNNNNEDDKINKKSTQFDRIVDDFIGKRYGAGEAFYGKRTSSLSEDEYSQLRGLNKTKEYEDKPMKENAILLVGDVHTGIAEFIAYDLYEKGFNIRLACTDLKKTIKLYGLPGNNVDMIELTPASSEEQYAKAIQSVQAIILCGNFNPKLSFQIESSIKTFQITEKIIDIACRAERASVGTAKKIIAVSRALSDKLKPQSINPIQYFEYPSPLYDKFNDLHVSIEKIVKNTGFDYVIIGTPPNVEITRYGSVNDLILLSESNKLISTNIIDDISNYSINPIDLKLGLLDLAEAIVQSLLIDVPSTKFTVFENFLNENQDINRIRRNAYYSILDMGESDLKSSYMIKSIDSYKIQLDEDQLVEKYWINLFLALQLSNKD